MYPEAYRRRIRPTCGKVVLPFWQEAYESRTYARYQNDRRVYNTIHSHSEACSTRLMMLTAA